MCIHKYVFTLLKDIKYKLNKQIILFILGFLMGLKQGAAFPTQEPNITSGGSRQVRVRLVTKTQMDNTIYYGHGKG